MRAHTVAATGANYEVWLSYRLGRNPALREVIDKRVASKEGFDSEFNNEIYERFFTATRASAEWSWPASASPAISARVIAFLKSAEEKSGDYGRTLETAATDLGRGLAPDQIANRSAK
ncbi:MAG: hypothetical protein WDM79_16150 [Terricaulis sp.]